MTVLGIDPGSSQSAWVLWDGERVIAHEKAPNEILCVELGYGFHTRLSGPCDVVIEQVASYGMAVGAEVFETCVWTGRFMQAADSSGRFHLGCDRMFRRDVKLHLCGQARAKDSNIRQALIDKFGGKEAAIGKKAKPGPLYGIKADEWAALALAITFMETRGAESVKGESAVITQ